MTLITITTMSPEAWIGQLKALFPQPDEMDLALAIYSFQSAYDDGLTPQQAYDDFDQWTRE